MPAPVGFNPAAAQAALAKAKMMQALKFKGEEEKEKEKSHPSMKKPLLKPLGVDLFHKKI